MESKSSSAAGPENEAAISSLEHFEQYSEPQTVGEHSESKDCEGNININSSSNSNQQSIRNGRPLGSRDKPEENPVVHRDSNDVMNPHVIQIEPGADIVQCLHRLYQSLQVRGLYVMSALGMVEDVTISMAGSVTCFRGIF
jgi:hypothetical protein